MIIIIIIIFGEAYIYRTPYDAVFLQPSVTASLLVQNTHLRTFLSNTLTSFFLY
jgi:hypothetical protein